jgi:hypothetical protein
MSWFSQRFGVILVALLAGIASATAQQSAPSWGETKCARYAAAWSDAAERFGSNGLGPEFLERHERFLASGCTTSPDVCPRSPEELEMANALIVAAMNAGAASTFPPFACK